MIVTLHGRGTLTVSKELRKKLGIGPGDPLEARVEDGRLILSPVAVVPRAAALSESGKRKISEAEKDAERGRVKKFASAKSLLKELDENSKN